MATPPPWGWRCERSGGDLSHLRNLPLRRSTPGDWVGVASASYPRTGAYRQSGIAEREALFIPLMVGGELLFLESIVAWMAPKVLVGVIRVVVGGFVGLPTKEWARLSASFLSWSGALAGLFS